MTRLSVIVPSLGRPSLASLLFELSRQTLPRSLFEVIVVLDGCDFDSVSFDLASGLNLRVVQQSPRRGPGAARNFGASVARPDSDWLVFTEDDVTPDREWLQRIHESLVTDEVDVIEGATLLPDGISARRTGSGPTFIPTNLTVRRSLFHAVDGYCEQYFTPSKNYFREDSDFGFSLLDAGSRISILSNAVVVHPHEHEKFLAPLRWARRYELDPLLRRRHQKHFRNSIEVFNAGRICIRRPFVRASQAYIVFGCLGISSLLIGSTWAASGFAIAALMSCFALWAKWRFSLRKLPLLPITPIILVASLCAGAARHRSVEPA
jgi:glycosyltransferase involved in cell wall biosynthesis